MPGPDLVRPSRDGDQFHYHWAARRCLELLPRVSDLVAVTIEGASSLEESQATQGTLGEATAGRAVETGEELIDVGLYFGGENRQTASRIRYIQLKHSTRHADEPWTASGLEKTLHGFGQRYAELAKQTGAEDVAQRFRFEFTTNRPIAVEVMEALKDIATGAEPRHPRTNAALLKYADLPPPAAAEFFRLFVADGSEGDLWAQRNLLSNDLRSFLPDADYDAPVQLKELVARKATSEFTKDPSIRRHDVLKVLKASEDDLLPAQNLIPAADTFLPREQEDSIQRVLLGAEHPVIIHAEGGTGKSVLASRLAASMPAGSQAVLYDSFGNGLYRNALNFRHRHRDALVQIANELSGRGLCYPLIPTLHADAKAYIRAFVYRLKQAIELLQARTPGAYLCILIDAADNAEMAASEQGEPGSFVRDLIRVSLPAGVRLAFTCRTHRRGLLAAPPEAIEIELRPFCLDESRCHLNSIYPTATEAEVAEFAVLSSANPRVQALALSWNFSLSDMLRSLGPTPTTVERAIEDILDRALKRLRDQAGTTEAPHIEMMCQGLAVLRPLVPLSVLANLVGASVSAVRSFALDFGRPLLVKGDSLHFLDEPTETWFRERFRPEPNQMAQFLDRLRPLTATSSYCAAALPQLLLNAGQLDELVQLALSGQGLPENNPVAKRDVELQRLTFALKACLKQGRHMAAAKLALKAAGEVAGEERQNTLLQANTHVAAALMEPDRIEDLVARRTFASSWMGSYHAYDAGLLSGRDELASEGSSRLRMAMDWLDTWARLPADQREGEEVSDTDRCELAMALLRLRGPEKATRFLRCWRARWLAFDASKALGGRLIDLGRLEQLDALAKAARNDVWQLLGLASAANVAGHILPVEVLARLERLLGDRRVQLVESQAWDSRWSILYAVTDAAEMAVRSGTGDHARWAGILKKYLPTTPPLDLTTRYGFDREPLLRAYALHASLHGETLALIDVAPSDIRKKIESGQQHSLNYEANVFRRDVDALLPFLVLEAEIICGRTPAELQVAIEAACKVAASAEARIYDESNSLPQAVARLWLRVLCISGRATSTEHRAFADWLQHLKAPLWPDTLIALARRAARTEGFHAQALEFGASAYERLEAIRDDAESRSGSYLRLAQAILSLSLSEAAVYFERAVEIASRIGDENLARWAALLHLGNAAAEPELGNARTAYRMSRVAELTYEYVVRDKHFDWDRTVEVLTDLCPRSALMILSRWRDRRFGKAHRLLPVCIERLVEQSRLPPSVPVVLAGLDADWSRLDNIKRALSTETDSMKRTRLAKIAYRYMRCQKYDAAVWRELADLGARYSLEFPDIERLVAASSVAASSNVITQRSPESLSSNVLERPGPDWDAVFRDVDITDAEALRAAWSATRDYGPPYEVEKFYREALARIPVGREPEVVRAIAANPEFDIFALRGLLDALPSPWPRSIATRRAMKEATLKACRSDPTRTQRRGWGTFVPFEKLYKEEIVSDREVVAAIIEGFEVRVERLGAESLFKLIDALAGMLSYAEADEALNFGLDLLEDLLKQEDGDGAWCDALQPPATLGAALAGYLWAGLGSPAGWERWEFAHAVRGLVELDWPDVLSSLVHRATDGQPGPFVDAGLNFYDWHARQWFTIGLARGALENPQAAHVAVPLLRGWVGESHVTIRALAAKALVAASKSGALTEVSVAALTEVNRSLLPETVYRGWSAGRDDMGGDVHEPASDDERYFFGIDIGPYWFKPLGRVFGLSEAAIESRVRAVLRRMGWKGGGWRNDARHVRKIFTDRETSYSHRDTPKTDDLIVYHAYHAMMMVAADLLKTHKVRRSEGEAQTDFEEWLSRYLLTCEDGEWIADRSDPCLVSDPPCAEAGQRDNWRWLVTKAHLDGPLRTDDGKIALWGHWDAGSDDQVETISIRSAWAPAVTAESLVAFLQTTDDFARFALPSANRSDRYDGADGYQLKGWVDDEAIEPRLEEFDPWSEGIRYPSCKPNAAFLAEMELTPTPDGRFWRDANGFALRSEVWARANSYGREDKKIAGWRLSADLEVLRRMCERRPDACLIVSVELRRSAPRYGNNKDEFEQYPPPYARYFLMGANGVAYAL